MAEREYPRITRPALAETLPAEACRLVGERRIRCDNDRSFREAEQREIGGGVAEGGKDATAAGMRRDGAGNISGKAHETQF